MSFQETLVHGLIFWYIPLFVYGITGLVTFIRSRSFSGREIISPEELSPVALRFFWRGSWDWRMLVVNYLEMVRRKIYHLEWLTGQSNFVIYVRDPEKVANLHTEERAGIYFQGKGRKRIPVNIARTSQNADQLDNIITVMRKKFSAYILPIEWITYGCLALLGIAYLYIKFTLENIQPSLGTLAIGIVPLYLVVFFMLVAISFWFIDGLTFLQMRVKGFRIFNAILINPLLRIYNRLKLGKVELRPGIIDHSSETIPLAKTLLIISFVGLMLWAAFVNGFYLFISWFLVSFLQTIFAELYPPLTSRGWALRKEIKLYREQLSKEEYEFPESTPAWIALDLDCEEGRRSAELLTGSFEGTSPVKDKKRGLPINQDWTIDPMDWI
ncbi:MAG: hypothetical protein AAFY71_16860 [Bacteroidota bacterium]